MAKRKERRKYSRSELSRRERIRLNKIESKRQREASLSAMALEAEMRREGRMKPGWYIRRIRKELNVKRIERHPLIEYWKEMGTEGRKILKKEEPAVYDLAEYVVKHGKRKIRGTGTYINLIKEELGKEKPVPQRVRLYFKEMDTTSKKKLRMDSKLYKEVIGMLRQSDKRQ